MVLRIFLEGRFGLGPMKGYLETLDWKMREASIGIVTTSEVRDELLLQRRNSLGRGLRKSL